MAHETNISGVNMQGVQLGTINGDAMFNIYGQNVQSAPNFKPNPDRNLGLHLGSAPTIDKNLFVGRKEELSRLKEWLQPGPQHNIVAVSGLGGVGKTQLCIYYACLHHRSYSSVFWLDARDMDTLKGEYITLATRLEAASQHGVVNSSLGEEKAIAFVRDWFSQADNQNWLLVFDNYDAIPSGVTLPKGADTFDIKPFFPYRAQGSILITTRSTRLSFAKTISLDSLKDSDESLALLARRANRDIKSVLADPNARNLASRLGGLPLALATAGSYLKNASESFEEYLDIYEKNLNVLSQNALPLTEYHQCQRTLWTTWNISLKQLQEEDSDAANLMKFFAYLSNQDIWYELIQAGTKPWREDMPRSNWIRLWSVMDWYIRSIIVFTHSKMKDVASFRPNSYYPNIPPWFFRVVATKQRFQRAMSILHDYSLVEVRQNGYSLHSCIHDWTLAGLDPRLNVPLFQISAHCIARMFISNSDSTDSRKVVSRLRPHSTRLDVLFQHDPLKWEDLSGVTLAALAALKDLDARDDGPAMIRVAFNKCKAQYGFRNHITLALASNLANHLNQEEQEWLKEILLELTKSKNSNNMPSKSRNVQPDLLTYKAFLLIGKLDEKQGKLDDASRMYSMAMKYCVQVFGYKHRTTLAIAFELVNAEHRMLLDSPLVRPSEAFREALDLCTRRTEALLKTLDRIFGVDDSMTIEVASNLFKLYIQQGKIDQGREYYVKELVQRQKKVSISNPFRYLFLCYNAEVLQSIGESAEAEKLYRVALREGLEALGHEDKIMKLVLRKVAMFDASSTAFLKRPRNDRPTAGDDSAEPHITIYDELQRSKPSIQDVKRQFVQQFRRYLRVVESDQRRWFLHPSTILDAIFSWMTGFSTDSLSCWISQATVQESIILRDVILQLPCLDNLDLERKGAAIFSNSSKIHVQLGFRTSGHTILLLRSQSTYLLLQRYGSFLRLASSGQDDPLPYKSHGRGGRTTPPRARETRSGKLTNSPKIFCWRQYPIDFHVKRDETGQ